MNAFLQALNDEARKQAANERYTFGPKGIQPVIDTCLEEYAREFLEMLKEREHDNR